MTTIKTLDQQTKHTCLYLSEGLTRLLKNNSQVHDHAHTPFVKNTKTKNSGG